MRSELRNVLVAAIVGIAAAATGCDRDKNGGGPAPAPQAGNAGQSNPDKPKEGEHKRLPIGEKTVGSLKLVATMDEPVAPGGEGAFDVVITGGKPKAVRFWVGTESGEGSVKAKAEEETPDNWHTHAEVPKPVPAGSKFWVEVEPPTGDTFKTSFDLLLK
jgi:hypothetical protein